MEKHELGSVKLNAWLEKTDDELLINVDLPALFEQVEVLWKKAIKKDKSLPQIEQPWDWCNVDNCYSDNIQIRICPDDEEAEDCQE